MILLKIGVLKLLLENKRIFSLHSIYHTAKATRIYMVLLRKFNKGRAKLGANLAQVSDIFHLAFHQLIHTFALIHTKTVVKFCRFCYVLYWVCVIHLHPKSSVSVLNINNFNKFESYVLSFRFYPVTILYCVASAWLIAVSKRPISF